MSKKLFISILILLASCSNIFSQKINFSATAYKTGLAITLDSVRVMCRDRGFDYTTKDTFILKSIFTSVKDEPTIQSDVNSIYISLNNKNVVTISINNNALSNSLNQIRIYNFIGNELLSRNLNSINEKIIYDFSSQGVYYIYYYNGTNYYVKKILIDGNNTIYALDTKETNAIEILSNYLYDFIGYKKGYKPDTLKAVDVDTVSVLNFVMISNSKYNFSSGKFILSNIACNYQTITGYGGAETDTLQGSTVYQNESNTFQFNSNTSPCKDTVFTILLVPLICTEFSNQDTIIGFCCGNSYEKIINNYDFQEAYVDLSTIITTIDELNHTIKFEYKYEYDYATNGDCASKIHKTVINTDIIISNISYTIDNYVLKAVVNGSANSFISHFSNSMYDKSYESSQFETFINKTFQYILDTQPNCTFELELYP